MNKLLESGSLVSFITRSIIFCSILGFAVAVGIWVSMVKSYDHFDNKRQEYTKRELLEDQNLIKVRYSKLAPPVDRYPLRVFAEVKNESEEVIYEVYCTFRLFSDDGNVLEIFESHAEGLGILQPGDKTKAVFASRRATKGKDEFTHVYNSSAVKIEAEVHWARKKRLQPN